MRLCSQQQQPHMWRRPGQLLGQRLRRSAGLLWRAGSAAPWAPGDAEGAQGSLALPLLREHRLLRTAAAAAEAAPNGGASGGAARRRRAAPGAPPSPPPAGVGNSDPPGYLDQLSKEQLAAVKAELGATRVVAGPGSGKTRVLISRIAHLLFHYRVPAWQVLAITFTNKAAGEMQERLASLLGRDLAEGVLAGTFHSFCHRLLQRELHHLPGPTPGTPCPWDRDFTVYDQDMCVAVLRRLLKRDAPQPKVKDKEEGENETEDVKGFQRFISAAKNRVGSAYRLSGEAAMINYFQQRYGTQQLSGVELDKAVRYGALFDRYQAELAKNNALDFDDLLGLTVSLLRECPDVLTRCRHRFRHVLVDEFQDTNSAQYLLLKLLSGGEDQDATPLSPGAPPGSRLRSVFVVGDPDQAIYGWRGADSGNMRSLFSRDFAGAKMLQLRDNYRSAECILTLAQRVIDHNKDEERGALKPKLPRREDVEVMLVENHYEEARYVGETVKRLVASGQHPEDQIAVLFRTHTQSRLIEQELVRQNVRYVLVGGMPFWRRTEVQDVLAYLRLAVSLRDDVALERVINVPRRAVGGTSVDRLKEFANAQGVTLSELLFGQPASGAFALPPLPDRKELGLTPKAAEAVEEFRRAVADMWGAVQRLPLVKAIKYIMKRVNYQSHVEAGGCASSKDDNAQARLERLHQLVAAADEYEPGDIMGVAAWESDSEADAMLPPVDAAEPGGGRAGGAGGQGEQQRAGGQGEQQRAGGGGGGAAAASQRRHNVAVARNFLDEVALYSGVEEGAGTCGVRLMTMHASKGLEFEAVFVAGCSEGRMPLVRGDEHNYHELLQEERRLFFVSLTRAKQRLTMVVPMESMWGQGGRPAVPSRFLEEALGPDVHYVKHRTRPGAQQGQQQRQRQQQRRRGQQDEQWEQPPIYSTRGARRAQAGSGARTAYARRAARQ